MARTPGHYNTPNRTELESATITHNDNKIPRQNYREEDTIRSALTPLADRLGAVWLNFCAKRVVLPFRRDPASLSGHPCYGALKGVRCVCLLMAPNDKFREGPLASGVKYDDELQKAILSTAPASTSVRSSGKR